PTLNMLTQPLENIKRRARRISSALKKGISGLADVAVISDRSRAGGGSLPEADFPTFVVSIRPHKISLNALERKLRNTDPPVIARIKDDALLVDARTLRDREVRTLVNCIISALS
ncbi:MAG TPA: L-seryl-tRNA(Sec) selenium transferase, partial [Nitrospirae bacterium]|nr:L-seryl-tRNA(Sec) selenium transferase [Nitrospirota bacterium]